MHQSTTFQLVNMVTEASEQTLSLQKDGDIGFGKTTIIRRAANKSIKRNEILQQSIQVYFRAIFIVM